MVAPPCLPPHCLIRAGCGPGAKAVKASAVLAAVNEFAGSGFWASVEARRADLPHARCPEHGSDRARVPDGRGRAGNAAERAFVRRCIAAAQSKQAEPGRVWSPRLVC